MIEIWKNVIGYEDRYQVSNLGNVKSLKKNLIMKPQIQEGYKTVSFFYKGKQKNQKIHKLVAMAFLSHIPCGFRIVVDHIDHNPLNNKIDNLQLITNRLNLSKDQKNKSSKYTGVSWFKQTNKWRTQIRINGVVINLGYFNNELEASKAYQDRLLEHQQFEKLLNKKIV